MGGQPAQEPDRSPDATAVVEVAAVVEEAAVVEVVVTGPDTPEFAELVRSAVAGRMAACCQVTGGVTSVYWWQEVVEESKELRAHFHTVTALVPRLRAHLADIHPYDVPCILVLPVIDGEPDYLDWVRGETRV